MFYITGDTHRDFRMTAALCDTVNSTKDDVLILLGDAGINYYGGEKDRALKRQLAELPITLFCIHGNHEQRPETLGYNETVWNGGAVYWEPEYPGLLFAKDGEIYTINGKRHIVIGGAYSVDKPARLAEGWGWWTDEQPSPEIRERIEPYRHGTVTHSIASFVFDEDIDPATLPEITIPEGDYELLSEEDVEERFTQNKEENNP